jgi:hypothetical protein
MRRTSISLLTILAAALLLPVPSAAQDAGQWRPHSTDMPLMPSMSDLQGDWISSAGSWLRGAERVTGAVVSALRATGTARGGSKQAQVVRFSRGAAPAVVWTDRNGDERADLIELYRSGTLVIQLIDADYNGKANVMRIYDASGELLREERL